MLPKSRASTQGSHWLGTLTKLVAISSLIATTTSAEQPNPTATVLNGTYEGLFVPTFDQDVFLGIPYAQDTSGANRFRIPQALNKTWTGYRDAKNYSHACPDPDPDDDGLYGMSEDCLSINVVRPAGYDHPSNSSANNATTRLPVMFWIHGGSYQVGTSGLGSYNLSYVVQRSVEMGRPVLAASINYRKGAWGNLYSQEMAGSGNTNLALRDMRQALAWVSENIAAFGGDPGRVTLWGESSGSFAVGQLLLSYGGRADGLFHASIQESGSAATAWYNGTDWYQPLFDRIVDAVNCTDAVDTLACLRGVPYDSLYPHMQTDTGPGFYPTVDGDIMPNYPTVLLSQGRFAHVPHLYGTNSDEGTANAPTGINTDDELFDYLYTGVGYDFPAATVRHIMDLYPDDPTQGIPLNTGTERFADLGWQYKRVAAIVGDIYYHATRWNDARHYSQYNPNYTFVYRFNTRGWVQVASNTTNTSDATVLCVDQVCGTLNTASSGVAHATELAFVFDNPAKTGPWPEYRELGQQMAQMWINFAHDGNPNGAVGSTGTANLTVEWPTYASGGDQGANLVLQTETQGGFYVEPDTYRLEGRKYLTKWARRRHV